METLQWYDYLRLLTAILCVASAYRLGRRIREGYKDYGVREAEYCWIQLAVYFAAFMGSVESVHQDSEYRYATVVLFLVILASFHAARKDHTPLFELLERKLRRNT